VNEISKPRKSEIAALHHLGWNKLTNSGPRSLLRRPGGEGAPPSRQIVSSRLAGASFFVNARARAHRGARQAAGNGILKEVDRQLIAHQPLISR